MATPTLTLDPGLESAIASGHPWLYRNHLPRHNLEDGAWLRVRAGSAENVGIYDANGQIAVRFFGDVTAQNWLSARVRDAVELRRAFVASDTTNCYRLLYGEGDYLPGITVDRYERYAVVRLYAGSVSQLVPEVVKALSQALKLRGIVLRDESGLTALWGQLPPPEVTVEENGVKLLANLYSGQKTGLFLDHRDNRQYIKKVSGGKKVLNLFSYSGAFSLYAALGGGSSVTSVDIAEAALHDAKRNFGLNALGLHDHAFLAKDVFSYLQELADTKTRFDLIILDPPSLAKNKKSRHAAARAYQKLNTLALNCLAPGGLLATASCTAQVSASDFNAILGSAAAQAGVRLQLIHQAGHAPDHPVPSAFPEGRYLKFVVGRVLP